MAIDERTLNGRLAAVETDVEWIKREMCGMKKDLRWLRDRAIWVIALVVTISNLFVPQLGKAISTLWQ